MSTSTHPDSTNRSFLATVRDELREQRQARRQHRALVRELSGYTSRSEIDDLMAILDHETGPEAEKMREILNQNLRSRHGRPLAS